MTDDTTRTAVRRLDVRRVIGALFVVYGVILTITGLLDTGSAVHKAQGVRVNLWTGLAMLALGVLFLLWQWWRPLVIGAPGQDVRDERPAQPDEIDKG